MSQGPKQKAEWLVLLRRVATSLECEASILFASHFPYTENEEDCAAKTIVENYRSDAEALREYIKRQKDGRE